MIIKSARFQSLWQTLTRVYHRISERSTYVYAQGKIWVADRQLGEATRHAGQRLVASWHATSWQTLPLPLKVLLGGVVVFVAVLAIWKIPQWQAARWEGRINEAKEIAKLENDARTTLVQAIGGAVLFIGLWFTWRNMKLAEKNLQVTQQTALRTFESTREGQITDRFTKAITQLGEAEPEKLAIRLGGIYALERIAKDSERDHWPIMEILTAYVREHAPWKEEEQRSQETIAPSEMQPTQSNQSPPKPATDIQAILTVLGQRTRTYRKGEDQRINLVSTDLRGAKLQDAHLEGASLMGAHLEGAIDLTVEQLATVINLHLAQLDRPLFKQIQQRYPHLLEKPQEKASS
jgi:hypothetical protein